MVAEIEEDPVFSEELKRLSQSFGIGVIQLDTTEFENSEILLDARERSEVDWETVNRIAEINLQYTHGTIHPCETVGTRRPSGSAASGGRCPCWCWL
ncbi:MAG: hypothetical protein ACLQNE_09900 [Thermoguttaceae bacterium]